jgi:tripartite-type tricarboxylate transporter receptor subunit TctC
MPSRPVRFVHAILSLVFATALGGGAAAAAPATYPTRTITIVVPLSAGGTADILARVAAAELHEALGVSVVVENRPGGAGGLVGAESVFRSPPDGYTLLCAPQLTYSVANVMHPKLAFDTSTFEPVSVLASYPSILLARHDLAVGNTAELIAYAKANPDKLNYGSQGPGQIGHLAGEQLSRMADIKMMHIPFRGSAPAITALLGGQIDVLLDLLPATKPHIQSGKMKLLAVASLYRLKAFPQVPTVDETLPGFEADTWMGIAAPPGTAQDIVDTLSDTIGKSFRKPDVKSRIEALDVEPRGTTPAEMRELIRQSSERWTPLIRDAKITVE